MQTLKACSQGWDSPRRKQPQSTWYERAEAIVVGEGPPDSGYGGADVNRGIHSPAVGAGLLYGDLDWSLLQC
jgi:hypothetical protein